MKIYPSNMNHLRYTKPTAQEIQEQYYFPCSITVLNLTTKISEVFYYDGEGKEFSLGKVEIPSDYLIKKSLSKTDPAPTVIGLYPLKEVGTYTNLGGLVTTADKLNFASFDGTTWSKVEVEMPSGIQKTYFEDVATFSKEDEVLYDANVDSYKKKYNNEDVGYKVKKNGTYEEAWQEYTPLNPIKVNFGQKLRITGYLSQPWAIIGLDENYKFVKTFAFNDSTPSTLQEITIDDESVFYITTSSALNGITNFKITSLNLTSKTELPKQNVITPTTIVDGSFVDENGLVTTQPNLSYAEFSVEQSAKYKIYLHQPSGCIVGYGENNKMVEKYGRQSYSDTSFYSEITINPSDSVKKIRVSYDRDFLWKLQIVKTEGGIVEGQNFQKFNSLQSLVESNYKGLAVVGSQNFNKVANTNYITNFIREGEKSVIVPFGENKKAVTPQLISDDYIFPFANGYGAGTTNEAFLVGSLKDGSLIAYHYGTLQISIDDGETWALILNANDTKIDFLGRIDNVFICENSDLIIEHVIDGEANSGVNHYIKRLKYVGGENPQKWWINDGLKLTIKGTGGSAVANDVYISKYWGFDSYKNIVLLSEYGKQGSGGATHVYLSTDFGANFSTILDLSDNVQLTAINANLNSPMVQQPYGVGTGLHIHGVSYDYFGKRIYVCIGDAGLNGSHILWSDDLGATWKGNLYQMKAAMSYETVNVVMQSLKVIPFENHLVVESDATAQGFFYMERTDKDKIPTLSWLHDITKQYDSKLWDEGAGISFKPYMISNNSRFNESYPMLFATAIHTSADQMAGIRMKVIATWNGISFWNIWEILGTQINSSTAFKSEVYSTKNYIYILSEGRVGKNKYVKLSRI